jgi:hypothetical protein
VAMAYGVVGPRYLIPHTGHLRVQNEHTLQYLHENPLKLHKALTPGQAPSVHGLNTTFFECFYFDLPWRSRWDKSFGRLRLSSSAHVRRGEHGAPLQGLGPGVARVRARLGLALREQVRQCPACPADRSFPQVICASPRGKRGIG